MRQRVHPDVLEKLYNNGIRRLHTFETSVLGGRLIGLALGTAKKGLSRESTAEVGTNRTFEGPFESERKLERGAVTRTMQDV
jgi:hypothetical protein